MYYQQYVAGAVSTSILATYQMSFRFYLTVVVVSSIAGAISSLIASVADRVGRANIVVAGLLVVGLVTGAAVGAFLWRTAAEQVGVVSDVDIPYAALALIAGVNIGLLVWGQAPLIWSGQTADQWSRSCTYYYPFRTFSKHNKILDF